jgi:hypothetical protein
MLQLTLDENRTAYRPGDEITGRAVWDVTEQPTRAEVVLTWSTRGKGSEDSDTVETAVLDHPQLRDQRAFRFTAPNQPCSFTGKLISVTWAVELFVEPSADSAREAIVIAPDGQEITLSSLPETGQTL